MKTILEEIRAALLATIVLAILLCGIYPVVVWGLGQLLFPHQANGSLIEGADRNLIGSELIGQNFSGAVYFHPRPSAAGSTGYDAANSGGSNLGPTSQKLIDIVRQRVTDYRSENELARGTLVPVDAITAGASGLDPHISPQNARLQAARVARARGVDARVIEQAILAATRGPQFGILGEPGVNVLELNLALDGISLR